MNHSSDHQLHPEAVEISFVCPNEDRNETSNDLYGPGRTLEKAFDFGGRHIDAFISKTAERMGYGPRVTAQRIRRRREVVEHAFVHHQGSFCSKCRRNAEEFLRSPAFINAEAEKVKKDIKRLLKYVNSKVPSTQKQAMDQILDLSVDYSDVRAVLKSNGAIKIISDSVQIYSEFRFGDLDDLLLNSSRKALVSLGDAEINTLLQEWITLWSRNLWGVVEEAISKPLWNKIAPYLNNPETAFLVMRALRRTITSPCRFWTLQYTLSSVIDSPNYFEWEECETVFSFMFGCDLFSEKIQPFLGDWVFRYAGRMPGVFKTKWFQQLSMGVTEMDLCDFVDVQNSKNTFEPVVIRDGGGDGHTLSLDALEGMFADSALDPLSALVSTIERVLFSFAARFFDNYTPSPTESRIYKDIARCIDTSDLTLRAKVWSYVNYFLGLDIYRCGMMLEALSATSFGTADDFLSFKQTKREQCIPKEGVFYGVLYRHLDRTNNQIHLHDRYAQSCSCNITKEEEMIYYADWDLKMRVERGTTFSSAGLYPAVTEYDAGGNRVYVAKLWFYGPTCIECDWTTGLFNSMFSTITEGTKPEDLRLEVTCPHRKSLQIPEKFDVLVLRYAPDAYPKVQGAGREGLDATSPFSWRPAREHESYHARYMARVITAEEAMAGDEILDKDGHSLRSEGKAESNVEPDELRPHSCNERGEAEFSLQPDGAMFPGLSCEGDKDVSELETSESISQLSDGIHRLETDVHHPSYVGRMNSRSAFVSDEFEGEPELDSMVNTLEDNSCDEGNEEESNSPQSSEVELLSCGGTYQKESELNSGELDSLSGGEIGQPRAGGSYDAQLLTCNGGMETGLVSELDEPVPDETDE